MTPTVDHACPRCFEQLTVAAGAHPNERVELVCAEPYCDYVLPLSRREAASYAPRWPWQRLGWFARAAG